MVKTRKEAADNENLRIGRQIRDLRKAKGITLIEMAEKVQRSVGYISQVERGVSALPIPVLQAICDVLDVQISWFFHTDNDVPADELNHIVRANARRSLNLSGSGIREELLSPRLSGQLKMVLTTFTPGSSSNESRTPKGEEVGLIQSGTLELTIDKKQFVLSVGDSFTLSEGEPFQARNPSDSEDCVVVWTVTGGY